MGGVGALDAEQDGGILLLVMLSNCQHPQGAPDGEQDSEVTTLAMLSNLRASPLPVFPWLELLGRVSEGAGTAPGAFLLWVTPVPGWCWGHPRVPMAQVQHPPLTPRSWSVVPALDNCAVRLITAREGTGRAGAGAQLISGEL